VEGVLQGEGGTKMKLYFDKNIYQNELTAKVKIENLK